MPCRTRLSHKDNGPADPSSARKPRLSHNDRVFTDVTVVTDLHEIINLGSAANARETQAAPVNGRVCTNLYVAFDDQSSELGRADTRIVFVTDETKPFPSQYRARMHNHAVGKLGPLSHDHPGVELAIVADLDIRIDVDTRMQDGSGTDARSRPHSHTRTHSNPIGQCSRRRNGRPRVNTRCGPFARHEMLRCTGKIQRGVWRPNRRQASRIKTLRNENGPRRALTQCSGPMQRANKRQVPGTRLLEGGHAIQWGVGRPFNGAAEKLTELGEPNGPPRTRHP